MKTVHTKTQSGHFTHIQSELSLKKAFCGSAKLDLLWALIFFVVSMVQLNQNVKCH